MLKKFSTVCDKNIFLRRLREYDSPHRTVSILIVLLKACPFGKTSFGWDTFVNYCLVFVWI